jgi:hypothetical protein
MTAERFRELALALDGVVESAHMGHPDFRVNGRIFATLGSPNTGSGMVQLDPEDQRFLLGSEPAAFRPAVGAWGRSGSTLVELRGAKVAVVREAMRLAWEHARSKPPTRPRRPKR